MGIKKEAATVAKHSVIYGFGGVLSKAVALVMIPIYTKALHDTGYGVLSLLTVTTGLLSTVISIGITHAMFRFYYDYDNDKDRKEVISTALLSFSAIALCAVAILACFTRQFSVLILRDADYWAHFRIAFVTIWFSAMVGMGQDYLRIREWSWRYLAVSIARLIMAVSLNIYFIVYLGLGVMGVLLSTLITAAFFSVVLVGPLLFHTGRKVSISKLKKMVKFGAPLIFSNVARTVVNTSDRFFLSRMDSMGATGVYDLGYKFGTLCHQFVTTAFMMIWFPRRMTTFGDDDAEKTFARIFTYFLLLSTFVGLGISALSKDVIQLVAAEEFLEAYKIVPAVILCYIVFSFHTHFVVGLLMAKKTHYVAAIDMTNAFLNLGLNFLLIGRYHAWGAVMATFICFAFRVSATYTLSRRVHPIHFEGFRALHLVVCAAALYFATLYIECGSIWLNMVCKFLACFAYPVLLIMTGFLKKEETEQLRVGGAWVLARLGRSD